MPSSKPHRTCVRIADDPLQAPKRSLTPSRQATVRSLSSSWYRVGLLLRDLDTLAVLQEGAEAGQSTATSAPLKTLKRFGLWYGAYPYATTTVVDPPYGGSGAGGMEYPTFIGR